MWSNYDAKLHPVVRFQFWCSEECGVFGRCPWCNGYRRRKWTRRHEFKSWTRLIFLGKAWTITVTLRVPPHNEGKIKIVFQIYDKKKKEPGRWSAWRLVLNKTEKQNKDVVNNTSTDIDTRALSECGEILKAKRAERNVDGVRCLCFLRVVITKQRSVSVMFTWKWNSLRRHLWRHIILLATVFDCTQYSHICLELFIGAVLSRQCEWKSQGWEECLLKPL